MTDATKHDGDKPRLDLLDRCFLEETALVLGFGADKYAPHNYKKGLAYTRLIAAAMRHIIAFNDGEDVDPESGLSHLAHAACCLQFLMWMKKNRTDMDDRHLTLI